MILCPACAAQASPEAHYCQRCGGSLANAVVRTQGDRRIVTVLFADLVGFTSLCERMDPEAVTELINACFEVLTAPVYRYGGVVDKYIGDALMALFGAPVAHEDDPERAIAAAWEMCQAAERFGRELGSRPSGELRLRIGLNTGLVVAGVVGGPQRRDYTVMGDAVNLAQRLESAARPGSVLVSRETSRLAADRFLFHALPPMRLKGKSEPVPVFELAGPRDRRDQALPQLPPVGRETERAVLRQAWHASLLGQPTWLTLQGAAGMGKSYLAEDLKREAAPACRLIEARSHAFRQDRPFDLVIQLLEACWGLDSEAGLPERDDSLDHVLSLESDERDLLRLLWGLTSKALSGFSDEARSAAAGDAAAAVLIAAARTRPMLVILEDLQGIDAPSGSWLARFARALAASRAPIMVLALGRPGSPRPEAEIRDLDALMLLLEGLEPEACRLLALQLGGELPEATRAKVVARAEGNPLVLRELLAATREGLDGESLPASLQGLVAARLDRLLAPEREVLEVASVIGRSFPRPLLEQLLAPADPSEALQSLVARDLLVSTESGFAFTQTVVHEVTYGGILQRRRRDLHARVARILGTAAGADGSELARHWLLSAEPRMALPHLLEAAQHALRAHAPREAREALEHARDLLAPGERGRAAVLLELAEVAMVLGDYPAAREQLEAAAAESPAACRAVERAMAALEERQGAYMAALGRLDGLSAAMEPTEPDWPGLQVERAWILLRLGQAASSEAACEAALVGPPAVRARALSILGIASYRAGAWDQALERHAASLALRRELGDLRGQAASLNNLGMVEAERGRWQRAREHYEASLRLYRKGGDRASEASALNNLGDLAVRQGVLDEARARHGEALKLRTEIGDLFGVAASRCALGEVCRREGKWEEASGLLEAGWKELERMGETELLAETCLARGLVARSQGDRAAAETWLRRGLVAAARHGDALRLAALWRARAEMALEERDLPRARHWLDRAARHLKPCETPLERCEQRAVEALLLRAEGDEEGARAAAEEADRLRRELGMSGEVQGAVRPG